MDASNPRQKGNMKDTQQMQKSSIEEPHFFLIIQAFEACDIDYFMPHP